MSPIMWILFLLPAAGIALLIGLELHDELTDNHHHPKPG
jgi:hypothetical protein